MAKKDKLLEKLLRRPRDFTWDELTRLLTSMAFETIKTGKSGGSRRRFLHTPSGLVISLHKPHPGNELKRYQLDQIIATLVQGGFVE